MNILEDNLKEMDLPPPAESTFTPGVASQGGPHFQLITAPLVQYAIRLNSAGRTKFELIVSLETAVVADVEVSFLSESPRPKNGIGAAQTSEGSRRPRARRIIVLGIVILF